MAHYGFWAARVLLLVCLAAGPWWAGGSDPGYLTWASAAVACAGAVMLVGAAPFLHGGGKRLPVPLAALPAVGLLSVVVLQTVSPVAGDALETSRGGLASHLVPVTVCRASTRGAAGVLAAGVLVFLLSGWLFPRSSTRRVLWWTLALSAAATALVGVAGRLGWELATLSSPRTGLAGFARFVNRSNAAQFLNVGAVAVAALLWDRGRGGRQVDAAGGGGRRVPPLLAVGCGVTIGVGLLASLSRAGIAAPFAGAAVVGGCALPWADLFGRGGGRGRGRSKRSGGGPRARRYRIAGASVAVVLVATAAAGWWLGNERTGIGRIFPADGGGPFDGRGPSWLTLDGRVPHWAEAVRVNAALPVFGAGSGTYRYAYLPVSTRASAGWFSHADNQYVEVLVETGAVGLALTLLFLGLLVRAARVCLTDARAADAGVAGSALAGALGFQSLFDYGLTRPAVFLAAAAVAGAVCGRATHVRFTARPVRAASVESLGGLATVLMLVLLCGWAAGEHHRAAPGDRHRLLNSTDRDAAALSRDEVAREIGILTGAVRHRPDDVEARFALGRLFIRQYRDRVADALRTGDAGAGLTARQIESLSRPLAAALSVDGGGEAARRSLAEIRRDPIVRETLLPAFEHLAAARRSCPFVPRLDLHLARTAFAAPGERPGGGRFLWSLHRNSPGDTDAQLAAGRRAAAFGLDPLASACWSTALRADPATADSILEAMGTSAGADGPGGSATERLSALLPPDTAARLAAAEAVADGHPTVADGIASSVLRDVPAATLPAPQRALAYRLTGRADAAIVAYAEYLASAPHDLPARLRLTDLLAERGSLDDAEEQLALARALSPDSPLVRAAGASLERRRRAGR